MICISKLEMNEKCFNCHNYYYDGRYSDDWCLLDECPNVPDVNCLLCQKCPYYERCILDEEINNNSYR